MRVERDPVAPARVAVRYAYDTDADLARSIAGFLPALTAEDATLTPALPLAPGEIEVRIAGGPAAPQRLVPASPLTAQSEP